MRAALSRVAPPAFLLAACVARGTPEQRDHLPFLNRAVFYANGVVDELTFKPAAALWNFFLPAPVRDGVSNFWGNLTYFDTILNGLFQGKFEQAGSDTGRFLVNSTAGLLGFIDVGTSIGLERHQEDLGETLAHYGVGEGSYLVLPIAGPSTLRDAPGRLFTLATNPVVYLGSTEAVLAGWFAWKVDARARVDPDFERRAAAAPDPYAFTREAWLRHRDFVVSEGAVQPAAEGEELDELLDELDELEQLDEPEAGDEDEPPPPAADPGR